MSDTDKPAPTPAPTVDELAQRLSTLEAELEDLRNGLVRAKEIQLIDDQGRLRGLFRADGPAIELYNHAGETQAALHIADDAPSLSFADSTGQQRAWIGLSSGSPRMSLADEQGKSRVFVGIGKDAQLKLYDEKQRVIWSADGR